MAKSPESTVTLGAFTFYKPRPLPVIITLIAVGLCVGLGAWQMQRLSWKEGLIAKLESGQEGANLGKNSLPEDLDDLRDKEFHFVNLPGEFVHEYEFHLMGQRHHGQLGYDILTPFRIADDGRMILVNRGWVPTDKKEKAARAEEDPLFGGIIYMRGLVFAPEEGSIFLPEHNPEDNIWLFYDIAEMNEVSGLELPNVVVEMINPDILEGSLPIPRESGNLTLRNDHLNYAFIWFSLAFSGLAIFFIYHLKSVKGDEEDEDAA